MTQGILLVSGPLGMVTHPRRNPDVARWFAHLRNTGATILIPEIADYEVRRELIRAGKCVGIGRLDALGRELGYVPVAREVWLTAATLWADARQAGRPTAASAALDADVILAASAQLLAAGGDQPVIATTNLGHLAHIVDARLWHEIE